MLARPDLIGKLQSEAVPQVMRASWISVNFFVTPDSTVCRVEYSSIKVNIVPFYYTVTTVHYSSTLMVPKHYGDLDPSMGDVHIGAKLW